MADDNFLPTVESKFYYPEDDFTLICYRLSKSVKIRSKHNIEKVSSR